ncbi:BatD family protein [Dokdonella sp.]|uniref:BatD family protein n=1 Tax=Dokdonella sp. TaxID=2291710 RepID=UPI0035283094
MKMFLAALLTLLPPLASAAGGARAWLDRDSMHLGETVTLNVEVEDSTAGEPDFSVLLDKFTSLGTQSSRQISMTNGSTSAKTLWAIGLEPRQAGVLTIPAFKFGSASTEPLTLTVLPAATAAQGTPGDNVFIEVTADPVSPYVQQQVRYTVKLYFAVNLSEGSLDEPAASGVVVQKLGRDKQYVATLGERRYQVLERNYAVTPEQSGSLSLPALRFRGNAVDNSDPTGFFRRGRSVSASSDAVELEVRSKPASWGSAPWLPAASLSISDETELPTEVSVGDPVTRTIKLRAQGLGFEQLPELEIKAPAGTEVYPDKPDTRTRDDGTWLYGERTRKFAIVPTRPGKLVLPEVEVQWWNTALDKIEKSVLPAREINVLPGTSSASGQPPAAGAANAQPGGLRGTDAPIIYPSASDGPDARFWRSLALALAALWLLTLALWWRSRRTRAVVVARSSASASAPGRSAFLRATAMGDLVGAERALVAWARSERSGVRNIGELRDALGDDRQRSALDDLQRVRYAGVNLDGLSTRLVSVFRGGFDWKDEKPAKTDTPALPPLYPDSRQNKS